MKKTIEFSNQLLAEVKVLATRKRRYPGEPTVELVHAGIDSRHSAFVPHLSVFSIRSCLKRFDAVHT